MADLYSHRNSHRNFQLALSPKEVFKFLLAIILSLCAINVFLLILLQFYDNSLLISIFHQFNLNNEYKFPAYFASVLLLLCSGFLFLIYLLERDQADTRSRYWLGLVFVFAFLAVDEALAIHEKTIEPLRAMLGASGLFYYTWIIPYGLFVLILAVSYLGFLFKLPAKIRRGMFQAGGCYLFGALGVEAISGFYHESIGAQTTVDLTYYLLTVLEEGLEMLGVALFLRTLLAYLSLKSDSIQVIWRPLK